MTRELAILKRELSRGERGRGKRYSTDLQQRVVRWGLARRQEGVGWVVIAKELGLGQDTVRRWCLPKATTGANRALVPVKVVERQSADTTLALVSPNGFRVEGLTLTEVASLLKALG